MKVRQGHLTARQMLFCEHYVGKGKHCAALAARLAGYAAGCSHVTGCQLLKQSKIAARVRELEADASRALGLSRADVMAELVGAAELARSRQEPGAMIGAWKQVALMAGFYKPEEVKPTTLTPAQAALRGRYEAMSTEELAAILAG
jgi:phage terminase small subunit